MQDYAPILFPEVRRAMLLNAARQWLRREAGHPEFPIACSALRVLQALNSEGAIRLHEHARTWLRLHAEHGRESVRIFAAALLEELVP